MKAKFKQLKRGDVVLRYDQVYNYHQWYQADGWKYGSWVGEPGNSTRYRRPLNQAARDQVGIVPYVAPQTNWVVGYSIPMVQQPSEVV